MATLHLYSNRYIEEQVKNIKKNDLVFLEDNLSRELWSFWFADRNIDEKSLNITYITSEELEAMDNKKIKGWDHTVGNPDYSNGAWRKRIKNALAKTRKTANLVSPDDRYDFGTTPKSNLDYYLTMGLQSIEDVTKDFSSEINAGVPLARYKFDLRKEANTDAIKVPGEHQKHRELLERFSVNRDENDRRFARGLLKVNHIEKSEKQTKSMNRRVLFFISKNTGADYTYTNSTDRTFPSNYRDFSGKLFVVNQHLGKERDAHVETINGTDTAVGNNCIVYVPNENDTEQGLKSVYTSELYMFLLAIQRNAKQYNRDAFYNKLPYMDLSKTWTDDEVYQHHNVEISDQKIIRTYLKNNEILK